MSDFRTIRGLITRLERELDAQVRELKLSAPHDFIVLYPWEHLEVSCGYCGVAFCPVAFKTEERPRRPWLNDGYTETYVAAMQMDFRASKYSRWHCCSEVCQDKLQRIINVNRKKREAQWNAIKEGRKLLREARSWLKSREASP
jgi:hypothetical protein